MATTRRAATKTATATTSTESIKETKTVRKYAQNDLIPCRSLVQGTLLLPGKQSDILYRWEGYGDVREVEYRDLYSLKSSRSAYIYDPCFQIEDEELLEDPRWADVKELYDTLYSSEDISEILSLSPAQFKTVLTQVPKGLKNAIKIEVATRLENGTFDSIQKLRIVDEICGTELEKMI
nr:MAG TPA: hypothetical protein [Caudoviricetes sp.]